MKILLFLLIFFFVSYRLWKMSRALLVERENGLDIFCFGFWPHTYRMYGSYGSREQILLRGIFAKHLTTVIGPGNEDDLLFLQKDEYPFIMSQVNNTRFDLSANGRVSISQYKDGAWKRASKYSDHRRLLYALHSRKFARHRKLLLKKHK